MLLKQVLCVFICVFINVGFCQRRIVKGTRTHGQKRYMVYLVKSRESTDAYDSWLCGGALVTTSQILTSAACIVDIDNIYAIAGYRKYVNGLDIDTDNCTRLKKQRVVKIRVPREHIAHLKQYTNTTQWMTLDIGVATVEKPYSFDDVTFKLYCSYIPAAIEINYNPHLDKKMGTNVVALGWGRDRGTKVRDVVDRNSETLREVSIKIKQKEHCINKFRGNGLTDMIEKYMICTHGKGILDGEGYVIEEVDKRTSKKCIEISKRVLNADVDDTDDCYEGDYDYYGIRRKSDKTDTVSNKTVSIKRKDVSETANVTDVKPVKGIRRQGICQNDHGGPLVTWVGSAELLIGVAVNSLYDENFECIGPFLFTSTSAAGQIVKCLLANQEDTRRSCSAVDNKGYDIFEKYVEVADFRNELVQRMPSHHRAKDNLLPIFNDTENLSSFEVITL